ncbi:hypothetical protein KY290_035049 [Solanum tuberosum]|uniref:F-box associated beta-propeller type 1 domain-containing protein n=1 Tax=Solanum tuberosum TaxID=4113 RepID=A0ABQ7U6M9_SOLTU|nr:hypothetical protein KY290_035049 [Solanum tuberosum]
MQKGYFKIVGSYNGIVCLYDELQSLVLWNPSIHKFISIPMPSIKPQSPHIFVLGFGVDLSETDDYKLVRLVYHMNILFGYNGPHEIEIYSINSGVWRRVVGVEIKHCMVEVMWFGHLLMELYIGLRIEKVVGFRNNDDVLFSTRRTNLVSYDPNSGRNMDPGNSVNSDGFLGGMEAYGPNEQLDYKI